MAVETGLEKLQNWMSFDSDSSVPPLAKASFINETTGTFGTEKCVYKTIHDGFSTVLRFYYPNNYAHTTQGPGSLGVTAKTKPILFLF